MAKIFDEETRSFNGNCWVYVTAYLLGSPALARFPGLPFYKTREGVQSLKSPSDMRLAIRDNNIKNAFGSCHGLFDLYAKSYSTYALK